MDRLRLHQSIREIPNAWLSSFRLEIGVSASCKKFLLCFQQVLRKSGLNAEIFTHFWFSSEMQQRAERRQCAPWDHSTSVFVVVVVVVVVVRIQKCFLLYNYSQNWVFSGQLYKQVCLHIGVCIKCVCVCGHRCSFGRRPLFKAKAKKSRVVGQW